MKEKEIIMKALEIINKLDGIAPVEMSLGWTDEKNICHSGLVITSCPPIVIQKLYEAGFVLSMNNGKMHVTKWGC